MYSALQIRNPQSSLTSICKTSSDFSEILEILFWSYFETKLPHFDVSFFFIMNIQGQIFQKCLGT